MSTAFDAFVTVHQYQLASIPEELWQVIYAQYKVDSSSVVNTSRSLFLWNSVRIIWTQVKMTIRGLLVLEIDICIGNYAELHHGDPMEGYSLHVKADQTLKKHR